MASARATQMTGTNMANIRYKGTGAAITALLSGEVQLMFAVGPAVAPHIKSGKLRALAVTTAEPSALFPDLPTVAASGLPGFQTGNTSGMLAPAKTPEATIKRLNQETVRVLNRPELKEKFLSAGFDVVGGSPEVAAATIRLKKPG
jgi:tripartite-type tricarboxylate transporter receptor subunit TctC